MTGNKNESRNGIKFITYLLLTFTYTSCFICIRIFTLNLLLLSKRETSTFREKYSDIVNSKNPKNVKS